MKTNKLATPILAVLTLVQFHAVAATRFWDGGGTNGFWSQATNWVGDVAPVGGDTLVFSALSLRKINTNDLVGLSVDSIQFAGSGYSLHGLTVTPTSSVLASNLTGFNNVNFNLILSGSRTIGYFGDGGLNFNGALAVTNILTVLGSGSGTVLFLGPISGTGTLSLKHPGGIILDGTNTFTGTADIQAGTVAVGNSSGLGAASAGTTVRTGAVLSVSATVSIAEPLVLEGQLLNSDDDNLWTGPITLPGTNAEVYMNSGTLGLSGVISGPGGFTKRGPEPLKLTGTNTYAGDTTITEGILRVDGQQSASRMLLAGGTLSGSGRVGEIIQSTTGTVSPGASTGILTSSNVVLGAGTSFIVEINGTTAGAGYDQLVVNGSVTLGGNLFVSNTIVPLPGTVLTIIDNDGADAVIGTFNGLPQGASLVFGGLVYSISYQGGSGNDVTLTRAAVTKTWDGGGGNNLWSNPANWLDDIAPLPGDDLIFPLPAHNDPTRTICRPDRRSTPSPWRRPTRRATPSVATPFSYWPD